MLECLSKVRSGADRYYGRKVGLASRAVFESWEFRSCKTQKEAVFKKKCNNAAYHCYTVLTYLQLTVPRSAPIGYRTRNTAYHFLTSAGVGVLVEEHETRLVCPPLPKPGAVTEASSWLKKALCRTV
jgi:hypothetical protein